MLSLMAEPIVSLDNGLAPTPPMGWLAWERFTCEIDCREHPDDCISSHLFKTMANRLIHDGYLKAGYRYVNIDDCWSSKSRNHSSSELMPDLERFPDGIRELADYMHKNRLKLGIYGDCGTKTCGGYPAQLKEGHKLEDNYFMTDANTFASWEIDSFKFDGCHIDPSKAESICPDMTKSLAATKRDILMSCEWPYYSLKQDYDDTRKVNWKLAKDSCNLWRYFEDVEDSWLSLLSIIDYTVQIQDTIRIYHGPNSWFDPDQLIIGNFALSLEQARAQMAIWSIWSAPLYMSNDLRKIDPQMKAVLLNRNLISIDQDPLGVFGLMVNQTEESWVDKFQAFVKPIEPIRNGCPSFAIVYFNRATLGNGKLISLELRQLLADSALDMAAVRYRELYSENQRPGGSFDAESCRNKIKNAMTRAPNSVVAGKKVFKDVADEHIVYNVFDLFEDKKLSPVSLDKTLNLWVNPSGVRAVKLEEATNSGVPGPSKSWE